MPLRMPSSSRVHRRNDHWWPYASWYCHSACQQNLPMYHLPSRPLKNWDTLELDGCLRCFVDILTQSDLVFIIFQGFHVIFGTTLSHGAFSSVTEIVSFFVVDLKTQSVDKKNTILTSNPFKNFIFGILSKTMLRKPSVSAIGQSNISNARRLASLSKGASWSTVWKCIWMMLFWKYSKS